MPFIRMNLDTVARIERILNRLQLDRRNTFQYIDEFFPGMAVHLQVFLLRVGERKKGKNAGEKIEGGYIVAKGILNNLRAHRCGGHGKAVDHRIRTVCVRFLAEKTAKAYAEHTGDGFQGVNRDGGQAPLHLRKKPGRKVCHFSKLFECKVLRSP